MRRSRHGATIAGVPSGPRTYFRGRGKLVYEDADRAWTYLVSERRISPATIAIYGHSLGSAVAVDLASKHPEAGALIIEGVLTSIADLAHEMGVGSVVPVRLILT